jgi:hypothetical protein
MPETTPDTPTPPAAPVDDVAGLLERAAAVLDPWQPYPYASPEARLKDAAALRALAAACRGVTPDALRRAIEDQGRSAAFMRRAEMNIVVGGAPRERARRAAEHDAVGNLLRALAGAGEGPRG